MKAHITLILSFCLTMGIYGQAPQKMSFQAIIRNNSGQLVTNHVVGLKISILRLSATGNEVYTEMQSPSSNENGLICVEIGGGTGFDTISWNNGPFFLKTETDPTGGTNYTITGTSQLLSTPYSLYAEKAGNAVSYRAGEGINITDNTITNTGDNSITNEIQELTLAGTMLSLSKGGGGVWLPAGALPPGTIVAFAGTVIPQGWLLCDGSAVSRTYYWQLYETIGISWGGGNLTSTFNLPDLRGRFLRGVSGTGGVDEDKDSRVAIFNGGNTGNTAGSYQAESFKTHNHWGTTENGNARWYRVVGKIGTNRGANHTAGWSGGESADYEDEAWPNADHTHNIKWDGGNETRPDNANVNYIIKY